MFCIYFSYFNYFVSPISTHAKVSWHINKVYYYIIIVINTEKKQCDIFSIFTLVRHARGEGSLTFSYFKFFLPFPHFSHRFASFLFIFLQGKKVQQYVQCGASRLKVFFY